MTSASKKSQTNEKPPDWAHKDELLTEALMETFPCSDPIALSITGPEVKVKRRLKHRTIAGQR